jgi:hypothetical protein
MEKPAKSPWFVGFMIAALACCIITGCVKNEVLIKVKGDGTGNIVVTRIFARELVATLQAQIDQTKQQMASRGVTGTASTPEDLFYNEDGLKQEAGEFGPGVTFVKAQKYDKDGARGSIALYSFNDINEVFVNTKSLGPESHVASMNGGSHGDVRVAKKDDAFEFELTRGPRNQLKMILPSVASAEPMIDSDDKQDDKSLQEDEMNKPAFSADSGAEMSALMANGNPYGFTGNETRIEVIRKMAKGMLMSLSVEVDGEDVKSNASYRNKTRPNRYTLVEMDMDKMMGSKNFAKMLSAIQSSPRGGFLECMAGCPGSIMETNKSVVITFKSAAEAKPETKAGPKPEIKK